MVPISTPQAHRRRPVGRSVARRFRSHRTRPAERVPRGLGGRGRPPVRRFLDPAGYYRYTREILCRDRSGAQKGTVPTANLQEERNRGHGTSPARFAGRHPALGGDNRHGARARPRAAQASAGRRQSAGRAHARRAAAAGRVGRPEVGRGRPEVHQESEETHSGPGGQNAEGDRRGRASRPARYAAGTAGHGPRAARRAAGTARRTGGTGRASGHAAGAARHAAATPRDGRKNGRRAKRGRKGTGGNPQRRANDPAQADRAASARTASSSPPRWRRSYN